MNKKKKPRSWRIRIVAAEPAGFVIGIEDHRYGDPPELHYAPDVKGLGAAVGKIVAAADDDKAAA